MCQNSKVRREHTLKVETLKIVRILVNYFGKVFIDRTNAFLPLYFIILFLYVTFRLTKMYNNKMDTYPILLQLFGPSWNKNLDYNKKWSYIKGPAT